MKRLLALASLALSLAGCHIGPAGVCHYDSHGDYHCHENSAKATHHETTTVVYTSANNGGGYNNIIIVEEEPSYCQWEPPHYHDPEHCTFDWGTCCTWLNIGSEETYCYYDHCGWDLVDVYWYY